MAATIAILAITCVSEVTSTECNQFYQRHDFVCPSGKPIVRVSGHHDNGKEDRVYCYGCRTERTQSTTDCYDTGYVNEFDAALLTQCRPHYYLSAVWSEFNHPTEDRRFGYRCCKVKYMCTKNCELVGPVNDYDGEIDYSVGARQVIVGAYSTHNNCRG